MVKSHNLDFRNEYQNQILLIKAWPRYPPINAAPRTKPSCSFHRCWTLEDRGEEAMVEIALPQYCRSRYKQHNQRNRRQRILLEKGIIIFAYLGENRLRVLHHLVPPSRCELGIPLSQSLCRFIFSDGRGAV